jgi:hypothetical protein
MKAGSAPTAANARKGVRRIGGMRTIRIPTGVTSFVRLSMNGE